MSAFERLLELQERDSAVDRLRAQRERLAERPQLAERQAEEGELQAQLAQLTEAHDEAVREEKRYEDTVSAIGERMEEVEKAMYSGTVNNPRELQAMQSEVEQFKRQRRSLEDQELDIMERRETLDGEIAQLQDKLAQVRAAVAELGEAVASKEGEIDAELERERSARDAIVPEVPADLLELYEDIRSRNRGVGAARLVAGTCQACHLALPAVEVDRIKREPADALVRCDQCGAILVRS